MDGVDAHWLDPAGRFGGLPSVAHGPARVDQGRSAPAGSDGDPIGNPGGGESGGAGAGPAATGNAPGVDRGEASDRSSVQRCVQESEVNQTGGQSVTNLLTAIVFGSLGFFVGVAIGPNVVALIKSAISKK